ncbi:hypothetical protein, partial [Kingella kingae]|uniref:hypothetical protein n=1 Tax=Kingella kingae TaxID=504 RepID=UPI001E420E58
MVFDAGNLKAVSEKLLNVLPENVPVYFDADNDPNQTGLHKTQAAAEVWGWPRPNTAGPNLVQAKFSNISKKRMWIKSPPILKICTNW